MGHNVKEYIHSYQKKKDNLNDHVGKTNKRMSSLVELYAGYIQMNKNLKGLIMDFLNLKTRFSFI
ncbi:hypothetical protein DERP_015293 [Dermatophagoides pteronyssinus]|uniref:Uncharacterized protein n=1 Tax=Dermatophagoides pteronyssinus TaxID=6956 RepID=A0ABQ8J5U0_DERPT|nr:hypothetical protein DERP_015293 [Dermatophagoides pteronyssinus]